MSYKNGQESSQLAKIIGYERTGKDTKLDKITITYERQDGNNKEPMKGSKFTSAFTEEEKNLIKDSKSNGTAVNIVKMFQGKEGAPGGGYWNLKSIKPASEFKEKPKTQANGKSFGGKPFNEAGVKAGAVLHDAVAVAIAQHGKEVTTAKIETIAKELLILSTKLEEQVREGAFVVTEPKTSVAALISPEESAFDDLDDLLQDFSTNDL